MNRRSFVASAATLTGTAAVFPALLSQTAAPAHGFPASVLSGDPYIETQPIASYHSAPPSAYEAFQDMKFGVRIHWGMYSIWHRGNESWPFLSMPFAERMQYNELYKTFNPTGFNAERWMTDFEQSGLKMFAFTTKHHEGFSMFDTKTRVKNRANWTAAGGPRIEPCDLAYSVMESPFRRDIVKELCDAAHKRDIKIDLYFSHPDWYDADFRPYVQHPLQVPSSAQLMTSRDLDRTRRLYGDHPVIVPDPTDAEVTRMMARHRAQLVELLTNYGTIDMLCLDMYLGAKLWPEMRKTVLKLRELQPNVMLRDRGIGNYGDYYTPERVVPGSKEASDKPWFCIYPLGTDFSYEPDAAKYKGTQWIVSNLVDTVAKGGGFMIGIGPGASGEFHPEAIRQMKAAGAWLAVNGEAIYATRPRSGTGWQDGDAIRYSRTKERRYTYAVMTAWPGREVVLRSARPKAGTQITMLGAPESLDWQFDSARGTIVTLPERLQVEGNRPCQYAWALRMETGEGLS